jgi:hypothetical protein
MKREEKILLEKISATANAVKAYDAIWVSSNHEDELAYNERWATFKVLCELVNLMYDFNFVDIIGLEELRKEYIWNLL